ncbi:MAG: amino acid permease [Sphingobium sp.]
MNFVVATAALSAMNTSLYLGSRMLFSLARGGFAPQMFGRLNAQHLPMRATVVTGGCTLVAAASCSATCRSGTVSATPTCR